MYIYIYTWFSSYWVSLTSIFKQSMDGGVSLSIAFGYAKSWQSIYWLNHPMVESIIAATDSHRYQLGVSVQWLKNASAMNAMNVLIQNAFQTDTFFSWRLFHVLPLTLTTCGIQCPGERACWSSSRGWEMPESQGKLSRTILKHAIYVTIVISEVSIPIIPIIHYYTMVWGEWTPIYQLLYFGAHQG